MANESGYPTPEDLQRAKEILETKKHYAQVEKEQLDNLRMVRDAGLEITRDLKEKLRLLDTEKGGLVDITSLETKLSKQAKSINTKKQKLATTAQEVVKLLKKQYLNCIVLKVKLIL